MKQKCLITIMLMLLLMPIVTAYTEIDYSLDGNITWQHYENTNSNYSINPSLNFQADTTVCFRLREVYTDGVSGWSYICQRTKDAGGVDDQMIAIMILIAGIMGLFIFLGYHYSKQDDMSWFLQFLFYMIALLIPSFGIRMLADATDIFGVKTIELLNTFYTVYMYIYYFLIIMLFIYILIMFVGWMQYKKVPRWKKNQM